MARNEAVNYDVTAPADLEPWSADEREQARREYEADPYGLRQFAPEERLEVARAMLSECEQARRDFYPDYAPTAEYEQKLRAHVETLLASAREV